MACNWTRPLSTASATLLAALVCHAQVSEPPYSVPEPQPVESPLLVGSYYFPGHFNAMRWVPMASFGHPYPLLGYYRDGEPEVSDWHVKWAVEHGIDFFAFDWYYDYRTGDVHAHNNALDLGFLRARYLTNLTAWTASRLKVTVPHSVEPLRV